VAIHPTSADSRKNWDRSKFEKLAAALEQEGYEPHFILSPKERPLWLDSMVNTPLFPTLSELAAFLYESGYAIGNDSMVGHLSSNLLLPTLIIADSPVRMRLWRPGWHAGAVITPPTWIPNWKFLRLRRNHWRRWISVNQVATAFKTL
jgi:ADP-heptose:LPS heptosyltransferase